MNPDLQARIESYLLSVGGWVKAREIATRFQIGERALRAVDGVPGLCSAYAISLPSKGLKHVSHATPDEWRHCRHQLRRHAIGELRRVRMLSNRRRHVLQNGREVDSGQLVLFSQTDLK